MRRLVVLIAPLAVLGLLAACGDDSSSVSSGGSTTSSSTSTTGGSTTTTVTDGGGTTATTAEPTTKPTTKDPAADGAVAIEIRQGGGFSPQGLDFSSVPTIVLADGRAFTGGVVPMIFPGPPITPVLTGRLSAAVVQQLVAAAKAAGLDGGLSDFGTPGVSDMASTTVRVVIDGHEHTTSVYALGYDAGGNGVNAQQQANRQKVSDFVAKVQDSAGQAAGSTPLEPTGYEVLGFEVDSASAHEGQPAPNDLDWPFADVPLGSSTCARLSGARAATFTKALKSATSITVWHAGGRAYHLSIRASLPGRTDCP